MRIAIAEFSQETDTFTPLPSDVSSFEKSTLLAGHDILEKRNGNGVLDGVRLYFRDRKDVELLPVLSAKAVAGGKLKQEAVAFFVRKLTEGLRKLPPFDAMLLSLHGATVSEEEDDVCGYILETVREAIGADIPLVVPLDHHANITSRIVEHSDLTVGHETQPHDPPATGSKAAAALDDLLKRRPRIAKGWVKIPMIAPQDQFLTSTGPMKSWFDRARGIEHGRGVLSVSLYPMQPWIDVREGGWTVTVYTEDDPALARSLAAELAELAWQLREEFWISERLSPAEAIRKAVEAEKPLVVLSDTGDAVYGGAPGDSTTLLGEMVRQRIPCPALVPLVDAEAVERAHAHGIGGATLTIGARHDPFSRPLELSGRIGAICQGLRLTSERGLTDIGKSVLFEVGNIKIVLLQAGGFAINQPILYTHLGLRIEEAKMVVLKTGSNFQYFDPWRSELVRADTPGCTQSRLAEFEWKRLPRPIFPLDDIPRWNAHEAVRSSPPL